MAQIPSLEIFNFEKAYEYRKQVLDEEKKVKEPGRKEKKKATKGKTKVDKT